MHFKIWGNFSFFTWQRYNFFLEFLIGSYIFFYILSLHMQCITCVDLSMVKRTNSLFALLKSQNSW
jgi:hypothetical protein